MNMSEYLKEIRFAASKVMTALWAERATLVDLEAELAKQTQATDYGYRRANALANDAEDAEDTAMAAGVFWNTFHNEDRDRREVDWKVQSLREQIAAHSFAEAALAATLLQFAKQGLSIAHGGLTKAPNGRSLGSQNLKDVVWQARNQSLHWEDGEFSPPVDKCFSALAQDCGDAFADYESRNLGFEVIRLLDWKSMANFECDMRSLS